MPQLPILHPSTTNSPKRKTIDTTPPHSPRNADPNSPRSIVADQLEGLDLRGSVPPLNFGVDAAIKAPKATKRARRTDSDGPGMKKEGFEDVQPSALDMRPKKKETLSPKSPVSQPPPPRLLEIQETPQPALLQQRPSACSPSTSPLVKLACHASSTPAPLPASDNVPSDPATGDTPSPRSLTWQEEEITGHLVNPGDDPDDDGYGINGIGFKPTPTMAYARSQRRRQQLLEWRAREAREARAKRSQRRLRGVDSMSDPDSGQPEKNKRVVRFA